MSFSYSSKKPSYQFVPYSSVSSTENHVVYEQQFADTLQQINGFLKRVLQQGHYDPFPDVAGLWEAMGYATLDGGKRIRSILAIEACKACGGDITQILPTACAIELLHAQSLIHDDLPCMDNDDLRRGKPSVHKAFGESTAVLAGDALIAMGFGLIIKETPIGLRGKNDYAVDPNLLLEVLSEFSDVASVKGLVNGQFVDILYEDKHYQQETLEYIHTYKTGALFRFALWAGAKLAGSPPSVVERFTLLGQRLGLAFQIVDDLLDIDSTSDTLGKTTGKDQAKNKATYPAFFGELSSRRQVNQLCDEVLALLESREGMPENYDPKFLASLARFIVYRIK